MYKLKDRHVITKIFKKKISKQNTQENLPSIM